MDIEQVSIGEICRPHKPPLLASQGSNENAAGENPVF